MISDEVDSRYTKECHLGSLAILDATIRDGYWCYIPGKRVTIPGMPDHDGGAANGARP